MLYFHRTENVKWRRDANQRHLTKRRCAFFSFFMCKIYAGILACFYLALFVKEGTKNGLTRDEKEKRRCIWRHRPFSLLTSSAGRICSLYTGPSSGWLHACQSWFGPASNNPASHNGARTATPYNRYYDLLFPLSYHLLVIHLVWTKAGLLYINWL